MKTIGDTIRSQYAIARSRGWDRTYWAVDLHSTVIKPNFKSNMAHQVEYYDDAREAMRAISERADARLIMYTCSWPTEIATYMTTFARDGIVFDWVNENPDVNSTDYGCYTQKPYFNILLDDKAGFDPGTDWVDIIQTLSGLALLERGGG